MEAKTKAGKVTKVALGGGFGIQFEDDVHWYNPTFKPDLKVWGDYKGKTVEILINLDKYFYFDSISVLEDVLGVEEKATDIGYPSPDGPITQEDIRKENAKIPENYFTKLMKLSGDLEKKGKFNYISWSNAWSDVKKIHPEIQEKVYDNPLTGMPYFSDKTGGFVKVAVSIECVTHTIYLPILDNSRKSIPQDDINVFQINTSIQRALVKCLALHGYGLYLYKGEDLPDAS